MVERDNWAEWLLETRFGGDPSARRAGLNWLAGVRDRVLDGAAINDGDVLLDVSAREGLIAFAALDRVGRSGGVVFSDISFDLLNHAADLLARGGGDVRCSFVQADAQGLEAIDDSTVDVLTTRSVLLYLRDKQRAANAFWRVLRPGGRASLYEPINKVNADARRPGVFRGYALPGNPELADRLTEFFYAPIGTMIDFDERDLIAMFERAGFREIRAELEIRVRRQESKRWDVCLKSSPNPRVPTLGDALDRLFTLPERCALEDELRPNVEAGDGLTREADLFLRAVKPE